MPPRPSRTSILACDPALLARRLWRALAPEGWPLALHLFPADTALVGGAVRDGLLGRLAAKPDLDLVVNHDAIGLARQLARRSGGTCVVLDQERSIARLVVRGWTIDLARRAGDSLPADLARRDFSVNAIALPLPPGSGSETPAAADFDLVDPHGGLGDLRAGRLVAIREENLLQDPLRLLRGVRLAAELDFQIDPQTWAWIEQHHGRIAAVAPERVLAELERLSRAPLGHRGLQAALDAGLLNPWVANGQGSGCSGSGPSPESAAAVLHSLTPERAELIGLTRQETGWALPLARLAMVLDRSTLERLHGSRHLQQRCQRLRQWQQRLQPMGAPAPSGLDQLGEMERFDLQRQLEGELPALLLFLPPAQARQALERWRDPADPLFHPRPPLDGHSLQQGLNLPAGPLLGQLIDHLARERAFGRIPPQEGAAEASLTMARHLITGGGLRHD